MQRMGSSVEDETPRGIKSESSETTIEIKIKTLDSEIYTLRVDKQMPVPALKEQVASVTGVLSDQQRLICRGKVLKDDQLLSAYHVEDGHTLHLVVRHPVPPSPEALPNQPVSDTNASTSHVHNNQVTPGLVIETFGVPGQGDGVPPEINRIISSVLSSIGLSDLVNGSERIEVMEHGQQRPERTSGSSGMVDTNQNQPEQAGMTRQTASSSLGSIPPPILPSIRKHGRLEIIEGSFKKPVIPDSLTTLSQYLSHLKREFDSLGRERQNSAEAANMRGIDGRDSNSSVRSGTIQEGFPTPSTLAEVLLSTRQMLVGETGDCLLQLARQLENHVNVTDSVARSSTQSSALRTGVLYHNLGAFLLELGRTIMTLRMGQSPSEAVVNAGPAVFISQSGPNAIMVQPLPFQQPGTSFPMGAMQPGSSSIHGLGTGFLPRHIDIQIRRGPSIPTTSINREELSNVQQPSGQREPTTVGGENPVNQANTRLSEGPASGGDPPGVRIVPIRTMAAVPGPFSRLPSDSSGNSTGLYFPVLGRFQNMGSGNASGEQHSISESVVHQQNTEDPPRDAPQGSRRTRNININILSAGGTQNNQESERQTPSSSVAQFLRALFPGSETETAATNSAPDNSTASNVFENVNEDGPRANNEGIFLSNLLRQVLPVISQEVGAETDVPPDSATQTRTTDAGTSRRQNDSEPDSPNSKRQKME